MSHLESVKATVKVTLTDPEGKVLKVIEGENPDPFDKQFLLLLFGGFFGNISDIPVIDMTYYTNHIYASPTSTFPGFGAVSMPPCLSNCDGLPNSPPNGPGFWFFSDDPSNNVLCSVSVVYCDSMVTSGIAYSPLSVYPGTLANVFDFKPGMTSFTVSQSATNVSGSPITVTFVALVAAIAGTANPSPILIPVSFFVFSPPLIWSPGVTITVSVTYTFPFGVVLSPSPLGVIFAL